MPTCNCGKYFLPVKRYYIFSVDFAVIFFKSSALLLVHMFDFVPSMQCDFIK